MLWNAPVEFWDAWGLRLMLAGAALGTLALVVSLASSFILYKVAAVAQEDSDRRIAETRERAAVLERDAAALRAQAESDRLARIKLEERIVPRRLSGEQKVALVAAMSSLPKPNVAVVSRLMDNEGSDLAADLKIAFAEAGAVIVPGNLSTWLSHEKGLFVGVVENDAAAAAWSDVLAKAGVPATARAMSAADNSTLGAGIVPGVLYVLVGAHP